MGSREGWKLYIVTGGLMVGIYLDRQAYLNGIMFDSLMIAF
jgi:hypothetical protein